MSNTKISATSKFAVLDLSTSKGNMIRISVLGLVCKVKNDFCVIPLLYFPFPSFLCIVSHAPPASDAKREQTRGMYFISSPFMVLIFAER